MNRLLISAVVGVVLAGAGVAAVAQQAAPGRQAAPPPAPLLAIGAQAPLIQAQAYLGGKPELFTLSEALKKGPVVLYFFPGAYTPGCNIEAKAFADAADKFKAAGAQIVGVTGSFGTADRTGPPAKDVYEAVKDFSTTHCNSKFPVMVGSADMIADYHAANTQRPTSSVRASYVITPDRKIAMAYVASAPDGHIATTLKAVQDWKAAQPKARPRARA